MIQIIGVIVTLTCLLGSSLAIECPEDFITHSGACYFFAFGSSMNWNDSRAFCQNKSGSHLVHVHSQAENNWLISQCAERVAEGHWINLSDHVNENTWVWGDDNTVEMNPLWYPGQPDSYMGTDEDCVMLYPPLKYQWVDAPCDVKVEPICELNFPDSVNA